MKLDQDYYTKSDFLSLSGLSYGRQAEFAKKAKVKTKIISFYGHNREVYSRLDIIKILKADGYTEHIINDKKALVKIKRIIEL